MRCVFVVTFFLFAALLAAVTLGTVVLAILALRSGGKRHRRLLALLRNLVKLAGTLAVALGAVTAAYLAFK